MPSPSCSATSRQRSAWWCAAACAEHQDRPAASGRSPLYAGPDGTYAAEASSAARATQRTAPGPRSAGPPCTSRPDPCSTARQPENPGGSPRTARPSTSTAHAPPATPARQGAGRHPELMLPRLHTGGVKTRRHQVPHENRWSQSRLTSGAGSHLQNHPPVRAQALSTHPGCDLLFARRRAVMPLDRSVSAREEDHRDHPSRRVT